MLTPDEEKYLKKIPSDKKVVIYPFSQNAVKTAEEIIASIKYIYPELEVHHMGASALGISGQKDLDIYALSKPKDFNKYLSGLTGLFGEPLRKHETFIEWKYKKSGFDIEFYLTDPDSDSMKRQSAVFEILKNNKELLNEYEKLKAGMNGKSFKDYQKKKYKFYHRILKRKIDAVLFDMVGVLLFQKAGYKPVTKDEANAEEIEKLYNHTDDRKLLFDIKKKLKLNNENLEKALFRIPAKYEKFSKIWELLPKLKKNYKLAIINNGNSLANKYWFKRFNFSVFDLFVNSGIEGIRKPGPEIFLLTCKRLKVKPENCLFMDDSRENIKTAKKLGMETVWWNKEERKETTLEKFRNRVA